MGIRFETCPPPETGIFTARKEKKKRIEIMEEFATCKLSK